MVDHATGHHSLPKLTNKIKHHCWCPKMTESLKNSLKSAISHNSAAATVRGIQPRGRKNSGWRNFSRKCLKKMKYSSSSSDTPCLGLLAQHHEWEHLSGCGNSCLCVFTPRQSIFGLMYPLQQHFLLHQGKSLLSNTLVFQIPN